jgi:hypothetical protein
VSDGHIGTVAAMPADDFTHLLLRLEERRHALALTAPDTEVMLTREALLDLYEMVERMARALQILEER